MTSPSSEPTNIDEAILVLQSDPIVIVKDKAGQVGNQKTKYADLVQVNGVAMPRLTALGVTYVAKPNLLDDGKFVLEYELRHVPSGTSHAGRFPLKLSDNPQAMGSAITYARRYILTSVLNIAAEDDDDATAGNETGRAQRKPRRDGNGDSTAQRRPGPPLPGEPELINAAQMSKMQALFTEQEYATPEDKKAFLENVVGHPLASTKQLTKAEAGTVIDRLEKRETPPTAAEGGDA